ncbi:MAG: MGMT family protein, partial [Pseudomonadales bacterium]|nr:MGMT family protein [Pseudomonadales bacterium]
RIPAGQTCSYGQIAQLVKNPRASRAVGNAVGNNPVSLLIPCHRVIRQDGSLGHYLWGIEQKQQLLSLEKKLSIT